MKIRSAAFNQALKNELNERRLRIARLKKERILTPDEAEEQARLRKEYLEEWRAGAIQGDG